MKKVKVEPLTNDQFLPFGFFANMINPKAEKMGEAPIEFYRDMCQQDLGGAGIVSFSICRVEKRPLVVDVSEYHTRTGEGMLPLDGDVLIHVAPATRPGADVPVDKLRIFKVPRGTMVVIRPGVWHHAAFTTTDKPANVLIVLPERTYANDCIVVKLPPAQQVSITG
jgi:ureidoglycolate lyase